MCRLVIQALVFYVENPRKNEIKTTHKQSISHYFLFRRVIYKSFLPFIEGRKRRYSICLQILMAIGIMYMITKSFMPSILLRACTEREDIHYVHDNPMRKIVNEGDHSLSLSHI